MGKETLTESGIPEMKRLAEALAGDWNTIETMERGEFFPHGGSRRGIVHASLIAGGTTFRYEVRSDGSAGELDGMLVIWWDRRINLYRFFVCFNNPNNACEMRGTAHWEGKTFVNDYERMVHGKKVQFRDSFQFTPTSHSLVAALDRGNGTWETLITTKATRT